MTHQERKMALAGSFLFENDGSVLDDANCLSCNGKINTVNVNFCQHCGEHIDVEQTLIAAYFRKGFEYNSIIAFLSKFHGISMSLRTLNSRLETYGLRRKSIQDVDMFAVRQRIQQLLRGPDCMGGYRSIWHTLKLEGIQVPRRYVEELLRELDPEGCEMRKAKKLRRRKYTSCGPNECWHTDGYDKLKPFGFPIHGCIDGWSRKILWLKVAKSNNDPKVPAIYFAQCISNLGGCPVKVRTDCGTENGIVSAMQCYLRGSPDAHKYGTSPANQRIEGWWSFLRRNRTTWWINYFKDLIERGIYNPGNIYEDEALWYCFHQSIQKDLDEVQQHWNTHRIRNSSHGTVPGRPDELFFLPELHGGEDGLLLHMDETSLDFLSEELLNYPDEEENIHREYFDYAVHAHNLETPKTWQDAENMYNFLQDLNGP